MEIGRKRKISNIDLFRSVIVDKTQKTDLSVGDFVIFKNGEYGELSVVKASATDKKPQGMVVSEAGYESETYSAGERIDIAVSVTEIVVPTTGTIAVGKYLKFDATSGKLTVIAADEEALICAIAITVDGSNAVVDLNLR